MRTNQMSRIYLGRNVYGLAAVIFGVITFAWRDLNAWREIMPLGKVTHPEIFLYTAAAIELIGGLPFNGHEPNESALSHLAASISSSLCSQCRRSLRDL